ncbi:SMI1/KNR4 family protein [Pseudomonas anguilliseptica]|uniref:SMI1/KNR4 family protein n=1 Tax=Pseudomonas anguilliseptica TaxID=53406 RepID=UPI003736501F
MTKEFLSGVEVLNHEFCSIKIDNQLESIALPFWSLKEIEAGLKLREEWAIPFNLIPFQGDWHDLLCIDQDTGKIFYINDERETVFSWNNTDEFMTSLSKEEIAHDVKPKLISAWINPELLVKANKFKNRR